MSTASSHTDVGALCDQYRGTQHMLPDKVTVLGYEAGCEHLVHHSGPGEMPAALERLHREGLTPHGRRQTLCDLDPPASWAQR